MTINPIERKEPSMRETGRGNLLCEFIFARDSMMLFRAFYFLIDSFHREEKKIMSNEKRLGFIGIVIDNREHIGEVNRLLSRYSHMIRGRIGIPNHENDSAVIGLITEGTNDDIGALTGKLGNIPGIIVKSALTPLRTNEKKEG